MRVRVEVDTARVVAKLGRLERGLGDTSAPLTEAGAYLAFQVFERITGRPLHVYTAGYLKWLIREGQLDGKILGILTGELVGAVAPGAAGGASASLRSELEAGGDAALVGFLDPRQRGKAKGFNRWHESRFGEPAIAVRPEDEAAITDIFDHWVEGLANGN